MWQVGWLYFASLGASQNLDVSQLSDEEAEENRMTPGYTRLIDEPNHYVLFNDWVGRWSGFFIATKQKEV